MDAIFTVAIVELVRLTLLALFLERALALVFESKPWVKLFDGKGLSPFVAFAVAFSLCTRWQVDSVGAIAAAGRAEAVYSVGGAVITAMILAGGSKLVMGLWRTVRSIQAGAQR